MKGLGWLVLVILACGAVWGGPPPVEFTFLGLNPAKNATQYKIKILTDRPVTQVDFHLKFFDQNNKLLFEVPVLWQNIVKSVRQPIEVGKTYTVDDEFMMKGAARAQGQLLRVWFKDGTYWEAPK
jgi:hypothetical protein